MAASGAPFTNNYDAGRGAFACGGISPDLCRTRVTIASVEKTVTIRLDKKQNDALTRRAKQRGQTKSKFVRELIKNALLNVPLGVRVSHLAGAIDNFPQSLKGWRREMKERNWRD